MCVYVCVHARTKSRPIRALSTVRRREAIRGEERSSPAVVSCADVSTFSSSPLASGSVMPQLLQII